MLFGVDYYPEHWPEERWATDAKMMRAASINVVRLAEFAWAKIEPMAGVLDFSWLDRAINVLAAEGIRVILGTPTAAPPMWLMEQLPDLYPVDVHGLIKGFGTRRHYCVNHEGYRQKSRKIVRAMASHYRGNANVVAWQIDNEFGTPCYCDRCQAAFHRWLAKKYKTIDDLNTTWGTVFWSQTYQSFSQVPAPRYANTDSFSQPASWAMRGAPLNHNPGLLLDWARFFSDSVVAYQGLQVEELRETTLPITHNFMGHYSDLDYFDLAKDLDVVSWDNYPNNMWGKSTYQSLAMAHDLMRGLKGKNFWMMEQQSGPCGWQAMGDTPEPGQVRLWTWQALAHGAEAMLYFRWRACTVGIEQYWHGILDHDGIGRRRYREIAALGSELQKVADLIVDAEMVQDVALVKSFDNWWSHQQQPHNARFSYGELLVGYHTALTNLAISTAVVSVEAEFSPFKLVLMPAFNLMTDGILEKCAHYVQDGGNLLITFRSGTRTWDSQMTTRTLPGFFGELAGIELEEYDSINFGRTVEVEGDWGRGLASMWCDVIRPITAQPLAFYRSHYYSGSPAITVNRIGKGLVFYVGCDLDSVALGILLQSITQQAGVMPMLPDSPPNLEILHRKKQGRSHWILMNHGRDSISVPLGEGLVDRLTGKVVSGDCRLEGFGVAVLQANL